MDQEIISKLSLIVGEENCKTTTAELNDFQIKSGAMYDKLADEANASNN